MDLKSEFVTGCTVCGGTGRIESSLCSCVRKFRAFNRLLSGGFNRQTLDLVSERYKFPDFRDGEEFVKYYEHNPEVVYHKGLSLFIFSNERGRGKTTLAHRLIYSQAYYLMDTKNYSRSHDFKFERADDFVQNNIDSFDYSHYVLDDLGAEDGSASWKREAFVAKVQRLLHYRRDRNLSTIITSNLTPSLVSAQYENVFDSLLEISPDGRIGGLLYRQVEVDSGMDYRLNNEASHWQL